MTALASPTTTAERPRPKPTTPASRRGFSGQWILQRFPVSCLLVLQYGPMMVYPALIHHTQPLSLILTTFVVGVSVAFAIEALLAIVVPLRGGLKQSILTQPAALVIWLVGAVAQIGVSFEGTYANQVEGVSESHLASVMTPFVPWLTFGAVMFIYLWREGRIGRTKVWLVLASVLVIQLAAAQRTAITVEVAVSLLTIGFAAVLLGFIRLRWIALGVVLIPLLWPPLYNFRNDIRHKQVPSVNVVNAPVASQRLREDLNFALIQHLPEVPDPSIGPSYLRLVRFSLIPRFLDPGRGTLDTPAQLSVALGGQSTTATTFTTIGTAYAINGWTGIVVFTGAMTVVMAIAVRRRTIWGYLVATILVMSGLFIESGYPDLLAAVMQALLSLVGAAIVVALVSRRRPKHGLEPAVVDRTSGDWSSSTPTARSISEGRGTSDDGRGAGGNGRMAEVLLTKPHADDRGIWEDMGTLWDAEHAEVQPHPRLITAESSTKGGQQRDARGLRSIIGTASVVNVLATAAAGLAGLLGARYLGPSVKGQFAAVTVWFGWAIVVGEVGQSAAIVYFVSRHPDRARDYVATSRNIMLVTGGLVTVVGFFLAPTLSHGLASETMAYRVMFLTCPVAFVGSSFLFALQARSIGLWIVLRAIQPVMYFVIVVAFIVSGHLTLETAVAAVVASVVAQAILSFWGCGRRGLLGGHNDRRLGPGLVKYGGSQMLATTPFAANLNLDQLVLSQAVPSSELGQYSLAATMTAFAAPFVAPIGSVLFPRLAAERETTTGSRRMAWVAVAVTTLFSVVLMAAVGGLASVIVPLAFGNKFRPAIDLIWIMTPAGVFLAINLVVADLLRGRGQPLMVAAAQLSGAVVTVVLLIVLIPLYGATGAAITTSVAYGVVSVVLLIALRRTRPTVRA
jgi:O-antigen/teichoic acid export membrane protein